MPAFIPAVGSSGPVNVTLDASGTDGNLLGSFANSLGTLTILVNTLAPSNSGANFCRLGMNGGGAAFTGVSQGGVVIELNADSYDFSAATLNGDRLLAFATGSVFPFPSGLGSYTYTGGNNSSGIVSLALGNTKIPATISCAGAVLPITDIQFSGANDIKFFLGDTDGVAHDFSGNAIPSASVNSYLAAMVAATGSITTGTIDLSGGTNGAPTGQGLTDKATLVGRGITVTTN